MIEEILTKISNSKIGESMNHSYSNCWQLNGFIVQKPRFIKHDEKGSESCSFILHQVSKNDYGQIIDISYSLITYLPQIVERLKNELDVCCFISCLAVVHWNRKLKALSGNVYDFEISCKLIDDPLESEYKK